MLLGSPVVAVNDATQYRTATDIPSQCRCQTWNRRLLVKSLVRPRQIVVGDIFAEYVLQMCMVDDDQLVQTLLADRSDPAFGKSIRIWRSKQGTNDMNIGGSHGIKRRDEFGIPVVDKKVDGTVTVF